MLTLRSALRFSSLRFAFGSPCGMLTASEPSIPAEERGLFLAPSSAVAGFCKVSRESTVDSNQRYSHPSAWQSSNRHLYFYTFDKYFFYENMSSVRKNVREKKIMVFLFIGFGT